MTFEGRIQQVVDGDTVDVLAVIRVRIQDIQAPEMNTAAGKDAKAHLEAQIPEGSIVVITPKTEDPHGRIVGTVAIDMGQRAVAAGHARRWTQRSGMPRQ